MPLLPTWLLYLLSPIGRYLALFAIAASLYGAWYLKVRMDVIESIQKHEQAERANANKKANTARARAVKRFDAGGMRDDGFRRD